MTSDTPETPHHDLPEDDKIYGNLLDYVYGAHDKTQLQIDISLREDGKVVVFYNHPFRVNVEWFEFDITTRHLNFVFEEDQKQELGLPIRENIAKNMQNTHQILTILLDNDTGQAKEARYAPLIIHQS